MLIKMTEYVRVLKSQSRNLIGVMVGNGVVNLISMFSARSFTHMHAYIYTYTYIGTYVHHAHMFMHVYIYTYTLVHMYTTHICSCMYICTKIYLCVIPVFVGLLT